MRTKTLIALAAVLAAGALPACGGDTGNGEETAAETNESETSATPMPVEPEKPPFSATYKFNGDDVLSCVEKDGFDASREDDPPEDDKVAAGVEHDRLLVGGLGAPSLRIFMFGSPDVAREQGSAVAARADDTRILGTVVLEPLDDDAERATSVTIDCLEKQAPEG